MTLFTLALIILFGGAFLCLTTLKHPRAANRLGPAVTLLGCLAAFSPAVSALFGNQTLSIDWAWNIPLGSFSLKLDALAAFFTIPVLLLCSLAAIYGSAYLRPYSKQKNLASAWFLFNILTGSLLLVVVANNVVLFLLAWETMSLASFFLVVFENEKEKVRRAGWNYLVATHIGTAFLLIMFALLSYHGGSAGFESFSNLALSPRMATCVFLMALIGFGVKGGIMPMHVWLPEAHPAAPSHVSAVMSGVMIKTGIYGLLRSLTFLGTPPPSWGWTLLLLGAVSGVLGILLALAQHNLKRFLAYCSVENIGVITLALGVGCLGLSYDNALMAYLGFAGGLLHILNHACFKGLLFLAAGSVLHATGTSDIERLGGLARQMPVTSNLFLTGSASICGLPPFNGFVSKFLIYLAALQIILPGTGISTFAPWISVLVLGALALMGGCAIAGFVKIFGVIFLGEPRDKTIEVQGGTEPSMNVPLTVLAFFCLLLGLAIPVVLLILREPVSLLTQTSEIAPLPACLNSVFIIIPLFSLAVLFFSWILALGRRLLLRRQPPATGLTWDCGYNAPTPRMQYTGSSFTAPITRIFRPFLRTRFESQTPTDIFPDSSSWLTHTPDVFYERIYLVVFRYLEKLFIRANLVQHGRLNLYILYIVLTLLVLLIWHLN